MKKTSLFLTLGIALAASLHAQTPTVHLGTNGALTAEGWTAAQILASNNVPTNGCPLTTFSGLLPWTNVAAPTNLLASTSPVAAANITGAPWLTNLASSFDTNGAATAVSNSLSTLIGSNTTNITSISNSLTNYATKATTLTGYGITNAILTNAGSGTLTSLTVSSNETISNNLSVLGSSTISSNQTVNGNLLVAGQTTLSTNQSAATDGSAMTRLLASWWVKANWVSYEQSPTTSSPGFSIMTNGSGSAVASAGGSSFGIQVTPPAASTTGYAVARNLICVGDTFNGAASAGDNQGSWASPMMTVWTLDFQAYTTAATNSGSTYHFYFGPSATTYTGGALTNAGYGFFVDGSACYGQVYGTSLNTTAASYTMIGRRFEQLAAYCDGTTVWFYVNGVYLSSLAAPTGSIGWDKGSVTASAENNGSSTSQISVIIPRVYHGFKIQP